MSISVLRKGRPISRNWMSICNHPHVWEHSAEWNWTALTGCIVSAAEVVVGCGKKKQPDWFIEAADTLQPLLRAKQQAHKEVLHTNKTANRKEFRRHQRIVECAMDPAKEGNLY